MFSLLTDPQMITESPEYDENEIRIRTQSSNNVKLSKKTDDDDDDHVTEVCLHFIICLFTLFVCVFTSFSLPLGGRSFQAKNWTCSWRIANDFRFCI